MYMYIYMYVCMYSCGISAWKTTISKLLVFQRLKKSRPSSKPPMSPKTANRQTLKSYPEL